MDILTQTNKFETIINETIKETQDIGLKSIEKTLELIDDELSALRDANRFIIKKKVSRTILTSIGKITFKRRYYYDCLENKYVYLLDSNIKIPRYSRISSELKIKFIKALATCSFKTASDLISPGYDKVSTKTIYNILHKSSFSFRYRDYLKSFEVIHLQIDEKMISKRSINGTYKSRLYTATIFTDCDKSKKRHKLINRTIVSNQSLKCLFENINYVLHNCYHIKSNTKLYISGDLAIYIQNSPHKIIFPCIPIYVPDKFHLVRSFNQLFNINLTKDLIFDNDFRNVILDALKNSFDNRYSNEYRKLYKCLKYNFDSLKLWYSPDYLGCSQEGMNSHYFAPRFDKVPNSFSSEGISKLSIILNAKYNNLDLIIDLNEDYISINNFSIDTSDLFYEKEHLYISFEQYKHSYRKLLRNISMI